MDNPNFDAEEDAERPLISLNGSDDSEDIGSDVTASVVEGDDGEKGAESAAPRGQSTAEAGEEGAEAEGGEGAESAPPPARRLALPITTCSSPLRWRSSVSRPHFASPD